MIVDTFDARSRHSRTLRERFSNASEGFAYTKAAMFGHLLDPWTPSFQNGNPSTEHSGQCLLKILLIVIITLVVFFFLVWASSCPATPTCRQRVDNFCALHSQSEWTLFLKVRLVQFFIKKNLISNSQMLLHLRQSQLLQLCFKQFVLVIP